MISAVELGCRNILRMSLAQATVPAGLRAARRNYRLWELCCPLGTQRIDFSRSNACAIPDVFLCGGHYAGHPAIRSDNQARNALANMPRSERSPMNHDLRTAEAIRQTNAVANIRQNAIEPAKYMSRASHPNGIGATPAAGTDGTSSPKDRRGHAEFVGGCTFPASFVCQSFKGRPVTTILEGSSSQGVRPLDRTSEFTADHRESCRTVRRPRFPDASFGRSAVSSCHAN